MNKKSFIITALVMNLTVCLTMCVIVFTSKDSKKTDTKVEESTSIDEIRNTVEEKTTTHKKENKETTTMNKTETTGDNHSAIVERPAESTSPNGQESETT